MKRSIGEITKSAKQTTFEDLFARKRAKIFDLNVPAALAEFRKHKINTKRVGKTLNALKKMVEIFPIASAECERGFSSMNLQHTSTRNCLFIQTVSALLMLQIDRPVHHFNSGQLQSM